MVASDPSTSSITNSTFVGVVDTSMSYDKLILFKKEDIFDLTIARERFHIGTDFILDAISHFNLDENLINSFIKFSDDGLVIDGNVLMEKGFKGKAIQDEKKRPELERFIGDFL